MAEPARPYTVERLAERWECSPDHLYDLIRAGKLAHFRVGRLIRVPRDEVGRFEQCGSSYTEDDGTPSGETRPAPVVSRSAPQIVVLPSRG